MDETGSGNRAHEIQERIGEGKVDEHPDTAEYGARDDEKNGRLGADDVDGDNAVNGRRSKSHSQEERYHQSEEGHARYEEKGVHVRVFRL